MTEKVQFDYRKLRGKIVEVYGSVTNFCDATGKNRSATSAKLTNGGSMRQEEIVQYATALGIADTELADYFFAPAVKKSSPEIENA